MHIVMLAGEYPPRWGGMATTIYHLTAELASCGHKVTVITRKGTGDAPPISGVRIIGVPWLKAPMAFTRSFGRHALRALLRLHAEDPVDVVHVHTPLIAWTRGQFDRCHREVAPTVTTLHGSWIGEREGLLMARRRREPAAIANPNDLAILLTAKAYARYEQAALEKSTCVAISAFSRQEFIDAYRPPEGWSCEVIHWGIDTEMFHPRPERTEEALALRSTLQVPEGHRPAPCRRPPGRAEGVCDAHRRLCRPAQPAAGRPSRHRRPRPPQGTSPSPRREAWGCGCGPHRIQPALRSLGRRLPCR